jgi:2-keto-3-deoxy-L-rhamnonate aldolase RhmA
MDQRPRRPPDRGGTVMKDVFRLMREGQVMVGHFSVTACPALVECIGYSGADFVGIDCEHAALSPYGTELESCVRAAYAADVFPFVRITSPEKGQVLKAVNFGAKGVLVPHINTPAEVEMIIKWGQSPPKGNRSCAPPVRHARHGYMPFPEFMEMTYSDLEIIPIFEEPQVFDDLEAILDVEHLGVVGYGPFDLAARLGGVGDPRAQELVDEHLVELVQQCNKRGIVVMDLAWGIEETRKKIAVGVRGFMYSTDMTMLTHAMKVHMDPVREEFGDTRLPALHAVAAS